MEGFNIFYTSTDTKEVLSSDFSNVNNFIFKEIFEYEVYNNIDDMKIKDGDVVVDVGAHIGIFSKYAALNGATKVISFEMNPKSFLCLKLNVREEDDVFNCVLLNRTFTKFKLDNDILITGFDLNYFYNGKLFNKIDFLKVDVMGKEMDLITSIEKQVFDCIKKISVKAYNISDSDKLTLRSFLKINGFNNFHNVLIHDQSIQFLYFWK
jgi:predicted RNA methylase